MLQKTSLLFVDTRNFASRIAASMVSRMNTGVSADSAGMSPGPFTAAEKDILHSLHLSMENPAGVAAITGRQYDIVITFDIPPDMVIPVLPGAPAVIAWKLPLTASGVTVDVNDADRIRSCIENKLNDFFNNGYFGALAGQREYLHNILDSLHEGILAHDLDRRVFFFSKGAEIITGIGREKVLGRDCHELFSPWFCGEKCAFCQGADYDKMPPASYSTIFLDGSGERKEFGITRTPLRNSAGKVVGAIATISDDTRIRRLEERLGESTQFEGIIGQDHKIQEIFELIRDLAQSDFPVIITGESGTGKELVANAIHNESIRRDHLFVPVNCGALPEGTLESELFGHVKGAFTGAIRDKKGRFELADKGTLFLDEVAELSAAMQIKLLRVLQEHVIEPVGSETSRKVDVRIISATNKNLKDLVAKGRFREDLYYRLAVVPVELPPLRERRNDIVLLADHFLKYISAKLSRNNLKFADETISVMISYAWPGNIRQLQNAIQFALIKCRGAVIKPEHLPPEILNSTIVPPVSVHTPGKSGRKPKLTPEMVERALERAGGNKAKAARILGVGRATLYNFMNEHSRELSMTEQV